MILIKPASFVGFLYHVYVGRESLDVRYCFLSKAWLALLFAPRVFAARSRVLPRLASLAQEESLIAR